VTVERWKGGRNFFARISFFLEKVIARKKQHSYNAPHSTWHSSCAAASVRVSTTTFDESAMGAAHTPQTIEQRLDDAHWVRVQPKA
jgi:hypothetical protein